MCGKEKIRGGAEEEILEEGRGGRPGENGRKRGAEGKNVVRRGGELGEDGGQPGADGRDARRDCPLMLLPSPLATLASSRPVDVDNQVSDIKP